MSYATSDKRIEALKDERRQLISAKQALERRIDELCQENAELRDENKHLLIKRQHTDDENAKLREYAARAWSLFVRHGAVHECDLVEVDAVRDGLRELGIEAG